MERLAERTTRVLLVEIGPEEGENGVTAAEATGGQDREVRQQDQALGLQRDRSRCPVADPAQLQAAQRTQFEHCASGRRVDQPRVARSDSWVTRG
jgi:hypothetical protein